MSLKNIITVLTCFLVFTNLLRAQIDYKGFPQWSWHKQDSTEYYLYTPSDMKSGEKYPIALFMHGCCGDSYHATLRNTVDPPLRMWHQFGANKQTIPTYLIAPATSRGWQQHFKNLKKVMDDLVANHNGDPTRIYVCGFSMGGEGTFKMIQEYPDYFAAAIPMGMSFRGDSVIIKDIPIWANQGETDWWSRFLKNTVTGIRRLNGDTRDTGSVETTGVNPRYSSFKGVGHGVQWITASTQDLTGWAYSKINDGNKYPIVFFKMPDYRQLSKKGESLKIDIVATDPDGFVRKVDILINEKVYKTLTQPPFTVYYTVDEGDTKIEAVATDNKGKKSTATSFVKVEEKTKLLTASLPYGRIGAGYTAKLQARGNGVISYFISKGALPKGCKLLPDGMIKGIPEEKGLFNIVVTAMDEDGDSIARDLTLLIKEKRNNEILVTKAITDSGSVCDIGKLYVGETLFTGAADNEITFSEIGNYAGMTLVKTPVNDTGRREENYLSFTTDENVIVYIGYEKKDRLMSSSIPASLTGFDNQPAPQIVAQYYYYDLYAKKFPKGRIILPGADEKRNNASTNYFVLVKKEGPPLASTPEITTTKLSAGEINKNYYEQLNNLYGKGILEWKLIKGGLPKGLKLMDDGSIAGLVEKKGTFLFTVELKDQNGERASADLSIHIK